MGKKDDERLQRYAAQNGSTKLTPAQWRRATKKARQHEKRTAGNAS